MRACVSDGEATYQMFRVWLDGCSLTDELWDKVMEEDEGFDYESKGVGRDPEVQSEVQVYTSSGTGVEEDDFHSNATDPADGE